MKERYLILSGEGERGHWTYTQLLTPVGLKRRLTAERCHGDRWAYAYTVGPELSDTEVRLDPVDGGNVMSLTRDHLGEIVDA